MNGRRSPYGQPRKWWGFLRSTLAAISIAQKWQRRRALGQDRSSNVTRDRGGNRQRRRGAEHFHREGIACNTPAIA